MPTALDRSLSRVVGASRTHLVIPDSHARPGNPLDRFDWLGRLVLDLKPDVVVDIGDLPDVPSLSSYDGSRAVGGSGPRRSFEGRRLREDIEVAVDARRRITAPLEADNAAHRRTRHPYRQHKPRLVWCEGNHEERLRRVSSWIPELDGLIGIDSLVEPAVEAGWEFHPYLEPVEIDGIWYSHYVPGGVMNRPIGSARQVLAQKHASYVWGHSHLRDFAEAVLPDGRRIAALNVGVYDDTLQEYAGPANRLWWRGAWLLSVDGEGGFEPIPLAMDWIRSTYGRAAA